MITTTKEIIDNHIVVFKIFDNENDIYFDRINFYIPGGVLLGNVLSQKKCQVLIGGELVFMGPCVWFMLGYMQVKVCKNELLVIKVYLESDPDKVGELKVSI